MKKLLVVLLGLLLMVGCSSNSGTDPNNNQTPSNPVNGSDNTGKTELVALKNNDVISTDFVEITVEGSSLEDEYKFVSKDSGITITSGLSSKSGEDYIFIKCTLKNIAGSEIEPKNIIGKVLINDKYEYNLDVFLCDEGAQPTFRAKPLVKMNYLIYASIPDELVKDFKSAKFTFGFEDNFEWAWDKEASDCKYAYTYSVSK